MLRLLGGLGRGGMDGERERESWGFHVVWVLCVVSWGLGSVRFWGVDAGFGFGDRSLKDQR
jgi:hypothetical protein